jgi:hypothetical protein
MSLLLGLVVAASFGSGDFLGGLASTRARTLVVLVTVQLCRRALVVAGPRGHGHRGDDAWALGGIWNVAAPRLYRDSRGGRGGCTRMRCWAP